MAKRASFLLFWSSPLKAYERGYADTFYKGWWLNPNVPALHSHFLGSQRCQGCTKLSTLTGLENHRCKTVNIIIHNTSCVQPPCGRKCLVIRSICMRSHTLSRPLHIFQTKSDFFSKNWDNKNHKSTKAKSPYIHPPKPACVSASVAPRLLPQITNKTRMAGHLPVAHVKCE